jgi:hypothetical protein
MVDFPDEWKRDHAMMMDALPPGLHEAVLKEDIAELSMVLEAEFTAGDISAPLKVVHLCIAMDMPIPEWAKRYFIDSCDAGFTGELKSWNQVFGPPTTRGAATREIRDRVFAPKIHERVEAAHAGGRAIDDELFKEIGRELGVGSKTLVKKLYARSKLAVEEVEAGIEAHEARMRLTPPKRTE